MSLSDASSRVATRVATLVPGTLTMVFAKPPQSAPDAESLPAAFTRPMSGVVSYSASQRQVVHTIEIVILVQRTKNLPDDYNAALPLIEPVIELFEQYTTLGDAKYFDAKITGYEIGPAGFSGASDTGGDVQYVAVVLTLTVKEKFSVTMN